MSADPHQLSDLADIACARFLQWYRRAREARQAEQPDLFQRREALAHAWEWRGVWYAVERELARVLGACRGGNA